MTSAIEQEICKAAEIKQKASEERQEFLVRIITKVQEIDESVWESLSDKAQTWVNNGAKAIGKSQDVPEFPDMKEDDVATTKGKTNGKAKGDKSATKAKAKSDDKPAAKAKADKPEKKAKKKVKAAAVGLKQGLEVQIKKIIIKKPSIGVDDLMIELKKKDLKPSRFTVTSIRNGFRHSIRVLAEAGLIKGELEI